MPQFPCLSRLRIVIGLTLLLPAISSRGAEVIAIKNGGWGNPDIWSTGTVPGEQDAAYIGTIRSGYNVPVASVALTEDTYVINLIMGIGYGTDMHGILDLAGHSLSTDGIALGGGSIIHNGGTIRSSSYFYISGESIFDFEPGDRVYTLNLSNDSYASTSESQHFWIANLSGQSILDMGADLILGPLYLETGSIVNMNGHNIQASTIRLGAGEDSTVQLNRGASPGSIQSEHLTIGRQTSFDVLAGDAITNVTVEGNSQLTIEANAKVHSVSLGHADLTTYGADAVTGGIFLEGAGTVDLGGDIVLSGGLGLRGIGGTLKMNGHNIEAQRMDFGNSQGNVVTIDRGASPGGLRTESLSIGYGNSIDILANDEIDKVFIYATTIGFQPGGSIKDLWMRGKETVTTVGTESIVRSALVSNDSTLELNADLILSDSLELESNFTIKLNGHDISAKSILFDINSSTNFTFDRGATPGSISTSLLQLHGQKFDLLPSDNVTKFELHNATSDLAQNVTVGNLVLDRSTARTFSDQNIMTDASIGSSSILELGADLHLVGRLSISNSTVKANGFDLIADTISINRFSVIDRGFVPGSIIAKTLMVERNSIDLKPGDSIKNLHLENDGSATSAGPGTVTENVTLVDGGVLNLEADLAVTGTVSVDGVSIRSVRSQINANGHNVSAELLSLGFNIGLSVSVVDVGQLDLDGLILNEISKVNAEGGVIHNSIVMLDRSILTIEQSQGEGLSFEGSNLFVISTGSHIDLNLHDPGWVFRWKNISPDNDWVSSLNTMISNGQFRVNSSLDVDYSIFSQEGYTYIGTAVPEVSSIAMIAVAALAVGVAARQKFRQAMIR